MGPGIIQIVLGNYVMVILLPTLLYEIQLGELIYMKHCHLILLEWDG